MLRTGKIGLLLLVLYGSALKLSAQVPGYMGKRLAVGYGFYFNPGFGNIIGGYSDSPINVLHEFFLEYTTGKKFTLGFAAQLYRYTYNNTAMVAAEQYGTSFDQIDESPRGTYKIKGRNYKLYGKFFKSDYLAPWGKYFLLGIALGNFETTYDPNEMKVLGQEDVYILGQYQQNQRVYINDFGPTTQSFQKVDLFFGNGNSRIIADKFTIDYGYSIGAISMAYMFLDLIDAPYEGQRTDLYIKKTAMSRTSAINRFNFFLKVGYLF